MGYLYIIFILNCLLYCSAQFTDDIHLYEDQCLGEDKIHCSDGSCIWQHQFCDGSVDCKDGSDESACVINTPDPSWCKADNEYLCMDKSKCIPAALVCDNETDCTDGSDEANCSTVSSKNAPCKGFECASDKRCISSLWVCDGTYDCADHTDEEPETCRHNRNQLEFSYCDVLKLYIGVVGQVIPPNPYSCPESRCLPEDRMCDGIVDCRDGSDEGSFCKNWTTMCRDSNVTCLDGASCRPHRAGPGCVCQSGTDRYDARAQRCVSIDKCAQPVMSCSQICKTIKVNAEFCYCEAGYTPDRLNISHLCFAPEPEGKLFFSTRNEIKYVGLRSKRIVTVATGVKQAHGVTFDGTYVYWVETAQGHQAIVKKALDNVGETKTVLVGLGLEDPGDVSVDWVGGNLYFNDAQRGVISVCDLNATMCATINTNTNVPKHLTLDVRNGKMYWADFIHEKPVIMSAGMDGSQPAVLVEGLKFPPTGLVVDSIGGRLFFVDNTIRAARLDNGKLYHGFFKTIENLHHPYALATFENSIYWSDFTTKTIQNWSKFGRSLGTLAEIGTHVFGMHIYHPILLRSAHRPEQYNCSHLRLVASNTTLVCACPDGMQLDHSNTTCRVISDYRPEYIVVGAGSTLTRLQYNALAPHGAPPVQFDLVRVQAMAYDTHRDTLYIYDATWKTIFSVRMNQFNSGKTEVLIHMGLDNVVDMDYDYIADNLYLLDAGRRFLEVLSISTGVRAILHRFDEETPISLCVVPEYGKLLVAVSNNEHSEQIHIDVFGMDGSGRRHLLGNNLKGPHIRMRYSPTMDNVYLADDGKSVIEHMHVEGTGIETFRTLSTSVLQLAVTRTLVVWSGGRGTRLYWADIHDTSRTIRRIQLSSFPNTTHLHIQATWEPNFISLHPCQDSPCSDVCVQTPRETPYTTTKLYHLSVAAPSSDSTGNKKSNKDEYKCLCPPGLLNVEGKCEALVSCEDEEAYCHISNVCILKSQWCDGVKDCQYGEDEEGCNYTSTSTANPSCASHEKLCNDMCIEKDAPCGLTSTTTEMSTKMPSTDVAPACTSGQFECVSVPVCIDRGRVCDGRADCPDGSDELPRTCATFRCLATEFRCTTGHCVMGTFRCDGDIDCTDGSDEFQCGNRTCPQGFFQCLNFECIEVTKRCDANQDCADFSDEDDCETPDVDDQPEPENCAAWEFACEYNRSICLPEHARCNGQSECPGSTDEVGCRTMDCYGGAGLVCREEARCVRPPRVCDGRADCPDAEDETPAACRKVNRTSKLYPVLFPPGECRDGYRCSSGQCVEWASVCDHKDDCYDGSDEGGNCSSACSTNLCLGVCQPSPAGAVCRCPSGYSLNDKHTCADEDECAQEPCAQHCYNTVGSFVCGCHRGYALRSDRRSCKAVKGNMSILYVTGNSVKRFSADGQLAIEYTDDKLTRIADMDYDVRRQTLYVTSDKDGVLIAVNSTNTTVAVTNIGRPTRVAVDWVTGAVYLVDSAEAAPRLRVCSVPARRCATLQALPLHSEVTSLVVDPSSRKLFYCVSRNLESVLWSSSLAGRRVTQLAVLGNCTGLTPDTYKKRLYVAESEPAKIYTLNYDGNFVKDLIKDDQHLKDPRDLAIFEDHIYFLVANSMKLSRCLIFNKKRCETYLQRPFDGNSFVIRHESMQRDDIPDFCEGVQCDNVCVQDDLKGVCLCDDGAEAKDGNCPLISKTLLPLFNGGVHRQYKSTLKVSVAVVTILSVLFVLYFAVFVYYHFVHKKRQARSVDYLPVHFQNSLAEGSTEPFVGLSPPTTPAVQMPIAGGSSHEFVNPLQFFRNIKQSFKRAPRPIGTAGLEIDVPAPLDVSDTESDLDDRDNKNILKK